MGFLSGRVAFMRFKVEGPAPKRFEDVKGGPLDQLARFSAKDRRLVFSNGKAEAKGKDGFFPGGEEIGWTAGEHILDVGFTDEKNIAADSLVFGLRVDSNKLPSELLRAYYANDLKALAGGNVTGLPTTRQKREAKESARGQLEAEAADGRFIKRKAIPVLWDRLSNEVLFGSPTPSHVDRLCKLFEQTFGMQLTCVTAGPRAFHLAEVRGQTRAVDDSAPSNLIPGSTPADFAWIADSSSRDFLGNEFLAWLWFVTETNTDTVKLADGSEVTLMLARSMSLDCPRGLMGHVDITHEGPSRQGEARFAIRAGKLPRKVGLTLVRNDLQYELTLAAETLAVSAAKLPAASEEALANGSRALLEERIDRLRHLIETLDLLYDAFGSKRFGRGWESELIAMQKWLKRKDS